MSKPPGTILTFYSYKGGTGRSLAVANVAWILASNGKRVLVIDWDLEAPGLHRYFHPFLIDAELTDTPGLIDFFWIYALRLMTPLADDQPKESWHEEVSNIADYAVRLDWKFANDGILDFIPAGRQSEEYAHRITSFDWNNFYARLDGEQLLGRVRTKLKEDYDYVIIDSRTGVSDTAGICTIAMPDSLVAMFTLNTQSTDGVAAVVQSVLDSRMDNSLEIYPIITRVELAEKERLERARRRTRNLFKSHVQSKEGGARAYWTDTEILYQPYYAYEEVLATFADETGTDFSDSSLVAAMLRLARRVTKNENLELPEIDRKKRESVLLRFTKGIRPKRGDDGELEGVAERTERADRYFQQTEPTPIHAAQMRARQARSLQILSTVLGIVAGLALVAYTIGTIGMESMLGRFSAIGGIVIAGLKSIELIVGQPRLTAQWTDESDQSGDNGILRLWIGGRLARRMVSAYILIAALVVCGASVYVVIPESRTYTYIVLLIGLAVVLGQSMAESLRVYESWKLNSWRRDVLERERRSYVNGIGHYDRKPAAAYRLFVERVEQIVAVVPESASNRQQHASPEVPTATSE